MLSVIKNL